MKASSTQKPEVRGKKTVHFLKGSLSLIQGNAPFSRKNVKPALEKKKSSHLLNNGLINGEATSFGALMTE